MLLRSYIIDVIDKIYLYAKDLSKPKHKFLIKKRQHLGIKHLNKSKAFKEHSNTMDNICDNIMIRTQQGK